MKSWDWSDKDLAADNVRYTEWYKCLLGYRDIVRIVDKCYKCFRHNWEIEGKFRTAMCSKAEHGSCPLCERLPSPTVVYATTILHLTHGGADGRNPVLVGKVLAWRFGPDKKNDLVEIAQLIGGKLQGVDLSIRIAGATQQEEKFQRLNIRNMNKSVLAVLPKKVQERLAKEVKVNRERIKKLYLPAPEDLKNFIKIEDEAETFDPTQIETSGKASEDEIERATDDVDSLIDDVDISEAE